MSDQYNPPRTGLSSTGQPGNGMPGAQTPYTEPSRTNIRIDTPASRDSGGGFGTGMLVAAVFAVVALIAFAVLGMRDNPTTGGTSPDVTIENNNAAPAPVEVPAPAVEPAPAAEPAPAVEPAPQPTPDVAVEPTPAPGAPATTP